MRSERVRVIVEMALCVGLAAVLSLWEVRLPWNIAGGSISLAMLPIFVIALRRGVGAGVLTGLLFGAFDYMREPFFVHPIQVVLDYGVAFAGCGLAGLGVRSVASTKERGLPSWILPVKVFAWTVVGGLARFAAAVTSGVVFFGANADPGQPVLIYSLLYNASYLVPAVLLTGALAAIIVPVLSAAVPIRIDTPLRSE